MKNVIVLFLAAGLAAGPAMSRPAIEEIIRGVFPDVERTGRKTRFLSKGEAARAGALAGGSVREASALVIYYELRGGNEILGRAYVDTKTVRSRSQSLLVVVDASCEVKNVALMAMGEPGEYEAPPAWLKAFSGRRLDGRLSLKGDVDAVTGATLTSDAVVKSVRWCLALETVLHGCNNGRR